MKATRIDIENIRKTKYQTFEYDIKMIHLHIKVNITYICETWEQESTESNQLEIRLYLISQKFQNLKLIPYPNLIMTS